MKNRVMMKNTERQMPKWTHWQYLLVMVKKGQLGSYSLLSCLSNLTKATDVHYEMGQSLPLGYIRLLWWHLSAKNGFSRHQGHFVTLRIFCSDYPYLGSSLHFSCSKVLAGMHLIFFWYWNKFLRNFNLHMVSLFIFLWDITFFEGEIYIFGWVFQKSVL